MIVGLGTDLFEVKRMTEQLDDLRDTLFTAVEIAYCESQRYPACHYAARFAAKEALLKALGTGLQGDMNWKEMDIFHDDWGAPHMKLSGAVEQTARELNVARIFVSLTHSSQVAMATVLLEA